MFIGRTSKKRDRERQKHRETEIERCTNSQKTLVSLAASPEKRWKVINKKQY